jgi:sortase A
MRSLRSIERNLWITGWVLLAFYAVWQIHAFVMSQAGLWSFHAHQYIFSNAHVEQVQLNSSRVDFSLWSKKRIQAYKDALAMKLEEPLAVLSIPKIALEVPVFEGTDAITLNRGAGRIAGTALPGQSGNIGIAAHRDGFFRKLKDIDPGDRIELTTIDGRSEYAVADIMVVSPSDVSVLRPGSRTTLTLVTCYPFYYIGDAPQRYVVHALLINANKSVNSAMEPTAQERSEKGEK